MMMATTTVGNQVDVVIINHSGLVVVQAFPSLCKWPRMYWRSRRGPLFISDDSFEGGKSPAECGFLCQNQRRQRKEDEYGNIVRDEV